jgi:protein gp37
MAGASNIEWTDATWNPIVGCSLKSPGCTNCYAMKMASAAFATIRPRRTITARQGGERQCRLHWQGLAGA